MRQSPTWLIGSLSLAAIGIASLPPHVAQIASPATTTEVIDGLTIRKSDLNRPPDKIAIFPAVQVAFAVVDGSLERFANATNYFRAFAGGTMIERLFPRLKHLTITSDQPDRERFMLLDADAAVVWLSDSYLLDKIDAPNLVAIDSTSEDYPQRIQPEIIRLAGALTGKSERAEALLSYRKHIMDGLQKNLAGHSDRPTTALSIISSGVGANSWRFATEIYNLNAAIEAGGGINLAASSRFNVGLERVIRYDPEVILIDPFDGNLPLPETLFKDPAWQALRAVRDRRVYVMPRHIPRNFAVDEPLLALWFAEVFHMNTMSRLTRAAYRDVYARVFNYPISDDEIDDQLYLNLNHASAGYERFTREATTR
jgi:iron complex transport system substrate-binding protein